MTDPKSGPRTVENAISVRGIIVEQFSTELAYKEGELQLIEDRIRLAKLMLQRLRLGVLAQHYGAAGFYPSELDYSKENVGVQGTWETFEQDVLEVKHEGSEVSEETPDVDCEEEAETKNCVPRVGGKGPVSPNGVGVVNDAVGWAMDHVTLKQEPKDACSLSSDLTLNHVKHRKGFDSTQTNSVSTPERVQPVCLHTSVPHTHSQSFNEVTSCDRNVMSCDSDVPSRFYRKKRIIVGNTSQFLDPVSSSGNGSTHKWMVYVRGSHDEPDISSFVCAVRFFLHPSYHPHDIILVSQPPFHLTKLGWGEFPVRVQLEFTDSCNKPVDIIHNLVLDRTHTGHQTLGAETIVDIDVTVSGVKDNLSRENIVGCTPNGISLPLVNGLDNEFGVTEVEEITTTQRYDQPMDSHSPPPDTSDPRLISAGVGENSPLLDEVKLCEESDMNVSEGGVSIYEDEGSTAARCCQYQRKSQRLSDKESSKIIRHISLPLVNGSNESVCLDHDYCTSVVTLHSRLPRPLSEHSSSTSSESSVNDSGSDKTSGGIMATPPIHQVLTTNLDKCLQTAVRAIPLCGRASPTEGFFLSATSLSQFLSWSVGRRRAAEWMRAVTVRKHVERQLKIPAIMTTKQVVQWCRRNGYTPLDAVVAGSEPGFCKYCGCQLEQPQQDGGVVNRIGDGNSNEVDAHSKCSIALRHFESTEERTKHFSTLSEPYSCVSEVLSLHDRISRKEKLLEETEEVDILSPRSPCSTRPQSGNDDESLPRYRIPQTPELKWIQQTAAGIGIRVYPAVIDRMYAHVVEHMIYMSCARFLRSILMQATQEAGRGIEGELNRERIIIPRHVHLAVDNLDSCDFLRGKYLGLEGERDVSDSSSDSDSDD